MTKAELRKLYLARRRAVSPEDAARWSAAIQARVLALPELRGREDVYIYVSAVDEVDTRGLMAALAARDRRVFAPVVDQGATRLHWGEVRTREDLRPGAFGLLEPPAIAHRAEGAHRGVAIVPCVAFTAAGDRLGRGGGYYDRFLARFEGPTIALAFEVQHADELPVEAHDVRVMRVITEKS